MTSEPDWMNFGAESDAFASASGDSNASHHPEHRSTTTAAVDDSVPLFLREDNHGHYPSSNVPALHATPPFLAGLPAGEARTSDNGLIVNAATDALRPRTAEQHGGVSSATAAATVMYANQPSAALLQFTSDSAVSWSLHRERILGKGNYGCATLYALDDTKQLVHASTSSDSNTAVRPTRAVVVKDINVQTMLNYPEDMAAVQNELRVLRDAAGHPNLVQYVDALFDSRPPSYPMCFIVMEYAAGGDLASLLEQYSNSNAATPAFDSSAVRVIPEDAIAAYFIQTAVALQSLHTEHGILHRDVKPHNIFLLEDHRTVRLGDFGISMRLGRVGDKAREACGSPYFMAPEIFEERPYDSAADVWSLGVVFYQLLAHQLPFTASSVAALGSLVRRGQFQKLASLTAGPAAQYSPELKELVDSLLTVDATARPTLRRVLRSRYVKEHLRCVPVTVLEAKMPVRARLSVSSPTSSARHSTAPVQFASESLYACVFGSDVVDAAAAHATHAGVTPIVNRVERA